MIEVERTTVTPETVTPLRLSEAIRLGCLMVPVQAFDEPGNDRAACVIATAIRAGAEYMNVLEPCPAEGCRDYAGLAHLNDNHRWSRERIADWLEGLGL